MCGVYCMWERFTGVTRCWCMSYVPICHHKRQNQSALFEANIIFRVELFISFIDSKYIFLTIVKWLIKKFALDLCNISFL